MSCLVLAAGIAVLLFGLTGDDEQEVATVQPIEQNAFWGRHLDALATEIARGKRERRMKQEEQR